MRSFITAALLLLLSFMPLAQAVGVLPSVPAPSSVSSPATNSSGTFNVYWSMSGGMELMSVGVMSAQTNLLGANIGGPIICPGGCETSYEFVLQQSKDNGSWLTIYEGPAKVKQVTVSPGLYRYRVAAKEAGNPFAGQSGYTLGNFTTVEAATPKSPENPVNFSSKIKYQGTTVYAPSQKDLIGTTQVNFKVDQNGAATFNVPLAVSPGMASVSPQLSLDYNSNNSMSGVMGKGWSLSGTSMISRCPKTPIQDSPINGIVDMSVDFDENDRFCLNGQKLILVEGSYGGNGAKYKTLRDDGSTVTSYTGSLSGPAYFIVKTKSGEIQTYGQGSANNYPVGNTNVIKSWFIKSIKDPYNNGIYFNYKTENNGEEFLLDFINYGSATDPNLGKVQVNYEDKTKTSIGYQNGYRYQFTKRIASVTSYYKTSSIFRFYDLAYEASPFSGFDRLSSITECADLNMNCLPSAVFEWQDQNRNYDASGHYTIAQSSNDARNYTRIFDINGDGYSDMVFLKNSSWYVTLGAKNSWEMTTNNVGSQANFSGDSTTLAKENATVMDFNGDGKQDLLIPIASGSQYKWYAIYHLPHEAGVTHCEFEPGMEPFCMPSPVMTSFDFDSDHVFTTSSKKIIPMDLNGDALLDVTYLSNSKYMVQLNNASDPGSFVAAKDLIETESTPPWLGGNFNTDSYSRAQGGLDVNGDGRTDLLVYHYTKTCNDTIADDYCRTGFTTETKWKVFVSNGDTLVESQNLSTSASAIDNFQYGDFNGDGLSDLLYAGTNDVWYMRLSNGKYFQGAISLGVTQLDPNKVKVFDYDMDGRTDIAYFDGHWRRKYLSNSNSYFLSGSILTSSPYNSGTENNNPQLADLNGDGQIEFLLEKDYKWRVFERADSNFKSPDIIKSYTSGYGLKTSINYESGKNEDVYTRGQEVAFPVLNINPMTNLVSQVDSDDGIGGTLSVKYKYAGLRAHTQGHGVLGFASITTIDENNDDGLSFVTTTRYNQGFDESEVAGDVVQTGDLSSWRYIGMPIATIKRVSNNVASTTLQLSENTEFDYKETAISSNADSLVKPFFANITKSKDTSYTLNTSFINLDGNLNSQELQTQTDTFVYDAYANLVTSSSVLKDKLTSDTFTVSTHNYYGYSDASSNCNSSVSQGTFAGYEKFGRLTCSKVTKSRTGEADITVKSAFGYNNNGVLNQEETSPGSNLAVLKTKTFTASGNVSTSTVKGKNYLPESNTYSNAANRVTTYAYNGSDPRFPSSVSNALGHAKSFTYDSVLAKKKTQTVNGVTDTFYFDDFGNSIGAKSGVTSRYSNINYLLCSSNAICDVPAAQLNINIQYAIQKLADGAPETVEYFDLMGRKVATRKENFNNGTYIYSGKIYTAKGHVSRTYSPSNFAPIKNYGSQITYDILDRPVYELSTIDGTNIDGGWTNSAAQISYSGRSTTSVNALMQNKTETKNAYGEVISIKDETSGSSAAITYSYYANGKLRKTTDIENNQIFMYYDIAGNKTKTIDPDMGTWEYKHNAFGAIAWQKDAKQQETFFYFDSIGRKTRRIDDAKGNGVTVQTACWAYDANFNGSLDKSVLVNGNRSLSQCLLSSAKIERKTLSYDSKNRPTSTYTVVKSLKEGDISYYSRVYYDLVGRVAVKQNTFDEAFVYEFNANGFKDKTYQASNNKLLIDILAVNEQGLVTSERSYTSYESILQTRAYNKGNGTLSSTMSSGAWGAISYQAFKFDRLGNLKQRTNKFDFNNDGVLNESTEKYIETFAFDDSNRIKQHKIDSIFYEYYCYSATGNLTHKKSGAENCSSSATHSYGNKPHQVSSFNGKSYSYDANGALESNQSSTGTRTIEYTGFNKANKITKGNTVVQFQYGVSRGRFERIDTDNSGYIVTHYQAGVEHIYKNSNHEEKFTEGNLLITRENGQFTYKGLVKDHLGSTTAIIDDTTFLEVHYRYDAFGEQYTLGSKSATTATKVAGRMQNTQRGFTGHEMVASVNIIHMKGRIYDPTLGRFLQADPHIQAPSNSQSYNRYAYVLNNPLSYTDPSGYFFKKLFKGLNKALGKFAPVFGLALMAIPGVGAWATATWYNAAAIGFISGGVATGSLKGALIGAFSGAAFQQIGAHFRAASDANIGALADAGSAAAEDAILSNLHEFGGNMLTSGQIAGQVASHAVAGGVIATLSGGKFGHGFIAAGFTKGIGTPINSEFNNGPISGTVVAATIGGTVSKITGGKFANGARTGAYQALFNEFGGGHFKQRLNNELRAWKNKFNSWGNSINNFFDERLAASLSVKGAVGPIGGKYQLTVNGDSLDGKGVKQFAAQATGLGLSASATADFALWKTGTVDGLTVKMGGCVGAGLGVCATYVTSPTGSAFVFSPGFVGGISITNSVGDSRIIGGN